MNFFFPSLGPFLPPSGPWGTALALVQCILVAVNGFHEVTNPTPYSKFATHTASLPSRYGMLLLYSPSMLVAIALTLLYTKVASTLAAYLVALHFAKRVSESLFLHRYSGNMDFGTSIGIGTFYALASILIIMTAQPLVWSEAQVWGTVMFILGELGNLYHHYLLRQLRANATNIKSASENHMKKKRYVPPTGGLFHFVAAPHYLFEITAFLGIAFAAQSLHALLVALGMASYLAGRAVLTLNFYRDTFDKREWSPDKKALIPFVF